MPWSVSHSADLDAVVTVYAGVLPAEDLGQAVAATIALAGQKGTTRFLADCASLEGGHSVSDLYGLAELLEASGLPWAIREAVVLPQLAAAAEDVRFWETVCLNRGHTVRVFGERAEAEAWLMRDRTTGPAERSGGRPPV